MSDKQGEVRTIHSRAIKALGMEACVVMLGVARDLRSGAIPPENYSQAVFCGTACCIAGHVAMRIGYFSDYVIEWVNEVLPRDEALNQLFGVPSGRVTPSDGADAIERYVYDGSEHPWLTEEEIAAL